MTLTKKCAVCKKFKPLSEFAIADFSGRAQMPPPSKQCKQCAAKKPK